MSKPKQKTINHKKQKSIWKNWRLYVMCLPAVLFFLLFAYKPMYGILIAFKKYNMRVGIMGSEWIGLDNFKRLFSSYWFPIILKNTLTLSLLSLILGFPLPIILALLLNEVSNGHFRKTFQTVSYAPHFISTVVMCGMLTLFLNPTSGIFNIIITKLGGESVNFLQDPANFKWIYVLSAVWQEMGWGSIIYFATLSGVDRSLLEAAEIDGATGIKCFFNITVPLLSPTIFFVMITRIIGALQIFDLIYMVMDKTNPALNKTQSLVFLFYKYTFTNKNIGYGSTIVILLLVVTLIITVIQMTAQKKWVFYN